MTFQGKKKYNFLQQLKFMQVLPKFDILNISISAFAVIVSLMERVTLLFLNFFKINFKKIKHQPNQQL